MIPPIANRFVAGESPAEALDHVRTVNQRNVNVIVNLLGEHYDDRAPASDDAAEYRSLVEDIANADLGACISVKPSQLGLDLGADVFREELEDIVATAADRGVFVWVDMEDHTTTDATLDAYEELAREYYGDENSDESQSSSDTWADGGIGVCVQANLKRTREDVERLADVPGKVRFVKGAYDEPADVAYTDTQRVNEEYEALLEYAFEHFENGVAVGSHDPEMIERAIELHEEYGTDFEIQMLMGVREDAQYDLAEEYEVWQYVPYGGRWKSYFYRRVMERKENLWFALRAIIGR
ncbi:proline dehydrogenase [Natrialba chahannaoensis JCM 10990]|uniref:proline dehydrogenase n=1 Tax=Natrialba chahannaoensis JCM 10990 TaxID=1227492 RepID=M0AH30_9EURY|nr:proline dehydrogenase family protein [Natrialba chahannaoensis]ELY96683.1 proline dehydrogenase [Natrialba chahannaoensis JCM 10990]